MKRCPLCKCGAEFTNKLEYYAKHSGAWVAGFAAAVPVHIFTGHGGHAANTYYKNLSRDIKKHYKCSNPDCLHEWDE